MRASGAALLVASAAAAAMLASGCGGAGSARTGPRAGAGSVNAIKRSAEIPLRDGTAAGTLSMPGTLTVTGTGTLRLSCTGSPARAEGSLGGQVLATETVHVEDGSLAHLRAGQVQPPAELSVAIPGRVMLWHIIQTTEARTSEIVIRTTSAPNCAAASWKASVRIIGHQGNWRAPAPWL